MTTEPRAARLAVLIDGDNATPSIAAGLFAEIATIGEASVRRIYGDFSGTQLRGWSKILARHAINPQHNIAYTVGKNASDIALVIDAMDLLHSGRFDAFCLVSSDSDFTGLAARIREQGVDVYGFGAQKTPESFRQACRRFIYFENLPRPVPASEQVEKAGLPPEIVAEEQEKIEEPPVSTSRPPKLAIPFLRRAVQQLDNEEGWAGLGGVGKMLPELYPDFDPRTYGCAKLSTLVEKTGAFEIDRSRGQAIAIRLKPSSSAPDETPAAKTKTKASKSKG